MSKIKLTGDTSGYVEISAPNVAANNTLELGGGTKILTNLDNVFTGVTTYSGNIDLNANLDLDDNNKILLGTGDDLQIYHDGSNSYIDDTGTGRLNIRGNTGVSLRNYSDSEQFINCYTNGTVELFHDNTKKLETTATGATITGTLVSGSVTSELDLTAISSSISDTAVDVFVYDTRKDSDGGAWRKRTQHTSWYNETLGTTTRGTRKEFPAVAVIVLDDLTTTGRMTIYDGDDPDLPMWMVFTGGANAQEMLPSFTSTKLVTVSALNGQICVGNNTYDLEIIDFLKDGGTRVSTGQYINNHNISTRNSALQSSSTSTGSGLVNRAVNDVAMTVLPNASIDDTTGLPIPTIAVATDGGVSVIKDDGTVVDITASGYTATDNKIDFDHLNNVLYLESGGYPQRQPIPGGDIIRSAAGGRDRVYGGTSSYVPSMLGTSSNIVTNSDGFATGSTSGLSILDYDSSQSQEMVAYAATSYNTGYMHGDIKGAFLSDTDTTNVTGSELITNTDFASDLSGWTNGNPSQFTRVTTNVGGDTDGKLMYYAVDNNLRTFTQYVTCVAGEKYVLSLRACSDTASAMVIDIDGTNVITIDDNNNAAFITKQHTFTAGSTSVRIRIESAAANRSYFTDFSVRLAVEDRSVNDNGLQVYGTVTKSAVATGAELVSYSGWSSSNYLRQPYNSDLDFGTGNWCYMFWYNPNDAESGDVLFTRWSYNVNNSTAGRIGAYFNSGNLRVDTTDDGASGYQGHFGSDGTQDSNEWHCAVILRRGPNLEIWIDGVNYKNAALNSTSDGSYTNTSAVLEIGNSPNMGAAEAGLELALFRVSGTAPSPEQIKKIYEDEKFLFQENAKATLYGSSDAVTALGYDEDTELLHIGTSSGRSDFQGLRRINNTTTAVTTAISASDELIAEQ